MSKPGTIELDDGTLLIATVLRIVNCDDGVSRLEPLADDECHRLSENSKRNIFTVGYLTKTSLINCGFNVEGE